MSVYSDIALELGLTGKYWPAVVSAFAAISRPARLQLHNFIEVQLSGIKVNLDMISVEVGKFDYVSQYIELGHAAITAVLLPVDNLLRTMPVDQAIFEVPEIADIFREVVEFIPLTIPAAVSETLPGTLGTDIFEGVASYKDLRYKLDEFAFRLARITSLRKESEKIIFVLNNQIDKLNKYTDIIIDLDHRGM